MKGRLETTKQKTSFNTPGKQVKSVMVASFQKSNWFEHTDDQCEKESY